MSSLRMPAEWESQSAVMLTWPHAATDWSELLPQAERNFAAIAAAIAARELVLIVCHSPAVEQSARAALHAANANFARLRFYHAASNDTWARDHGPLTVFENSQPRLLDFVFNGWGNKFPADLDNRITQSLHEQHAFAGTQREAVDLVMEGGALEFDGQGTLLTTSRCLLNPTRNPQLEKSAVENRLKKYFNLTRILWLEHGDIEGDDTDGHVDTLARFASPTSIVYQSCDQPDDPSFPELDAMREELHQLVQADGTAYQLFALPWPQACFDAEGQRLPATYANFLIINGAVLAAVYNVPQDQAALAVLAQAFPELEIVPIDCRTLIEQHGSLHCVTMQLPTDVVAE